MDLGFKFSADLTHVVKDTIPLQPSKTQHVFNYHSFYVSPGQVYTYMRVIGKGFTFCDRFEPEQLWILTQHVQPGAMDEPDPARRLKMFSVKIQIKGRVTILKSLNFAKGTILSQVDSQAREAHKKTLAGAQKYMSDSINKRLEHYLNKTLSDKIFGCQKQTSEQAQ